MKGTERQCAYPNRWVPPTTMYGFYNQDYLTLSPFQCSSNVKLHTYIRTYAHACTHTIIHTHSHTYTYMHALYYNFFLHKYTNIHIGIHKYIQFFSMVQEPNLGQVLLITEASRPHSVTHRFDMTRLEE